MNWMCRLLLGAWLLVPHLVADVTDPVGYAKIQVPAGESRVLPTQFAKNSLGRAIVVSVNGVQVTCDRDLSTFLGGGVDSAMRIRYGGHDGLVSPVVGVSGNTVTVESALNGYARVGDTLEFHEEWTLGEAFGSNAPGVLRADAASGADLITLWDAAAQKGRKFFLSTNGVWLEVGKEEEGDRSSTVLTLSSAPVYFRRADTDFEITAWGLVPWPSFSRYIFVHPGRNLISSPFTSEGRLDVWHQGMANTFQSGDSAVRADTLRFTYDDGVESPVVYLDNSLTWRQVGQDGDAGDVPIEMVMAIDLQRAGPAGFVGINGLSDGFGPSQRLSSPQVSAQPEFPITGIRRTADGAELSWARDTNDGDRSYRVQIREFRTSVWKDVDCVIRMGTSQVVAQVGRLEGAGVFRIVEAP